MISAKACCRPWPVAGDGQRLAGGFKLQQDGGGRMIGAGFAEGFFDQLFDRHRIPSGRRGRGPGSAFDRPGG